MLERHAQWPEALASGIARAWAKPFTWGENDCCLFACDCVLGITKTDIAKDFRGYKNIDEAKIILDRFGGVGGVAEAVAQEYGVPQITALAARRGDICLIEAGHGETLGVCAGDHILCPGLKGLVSYPLLQGIRAWKIG